MEPSIDLSMDAFVGQFACFLPMNGLFDEPVGTPGPWRSAFADDDQDPMGGEVFDDILAAIYSPYGE